MATTKSLTLYPQAHDTSDYNYQGNGLSGASNPVGKGTGNTTYASIYAYNMTAYLYWPFDVSAIPDDATIDSVACKAKVGVSAANSFTGYLQLFSGTTAKGSANSFTATTVTIRTISPGSWTRAELDSIRLRTAITTNTGRYLYFYGATLTITYTYQSEKFMLKLSGAYNDIARTFKMVSGIWVEQTDLANVVDQTKRLVNGGYWGNVYIDFTVDGTSCRAVEGMTWSEWLGSEYNTIGFREYNGLVLSPSSSNLFYSSSMSSQKVNSADVILAGNPYSTTRTG